jgi:small subunit ribosomal protein S4
MTRIINAKKKISRKLRVNLWGKSNDPYLKKNYKPGQHGPTARNGRTSDYGRQLKAKQQLRKYHNITEKQFKSIFKEASRQKGDASENFITLLELRLDTVIYRANFVPTIFAARQSVSHKHVLINGKKVNIASYRLKVGDVIELNDKAKTISSGIMPVRG